MSFIISSEIFVTFYTELYKILSHISHIVSWTILTILNQSIINQYLDGTNLILRALIVLAKIDSTKVLIFILDFKFHEIFMFLYKISVSCLVT